MKCAGIAVWIKFLTAFLVGLCVSNLCMMLAENYAVFAEKNTITDRKFEKLLALLFGLSGNVHGKVCRHAFQPLRIVRKKFCPIVLMICCISS